MPARSLRAAWRAGITLGGDKRASCAAIEKSEIQVPQRDDGRGSWSTDEVTIVFGGAGSPHDLGSTASRSLGR